LLTEVDIDLLATESFLVMLVEDYHVKEAETAWLAINIACGGKRRLLPTRTRYIFIGLGRAVGRDGAS
jgi:hypothetical protein